MPPGSFDTLVIGAGPAGATYATLLAGAGGEVAMVGAGRAVPAGTFELLPGRAAPALHELGVLDDVLARAVPCAGTVFRWVDGQFREHGIGAPDWTGGWVVDRAWLDPLLVRAAERRGVRVCCSTVTDADEDGALGWKVRTVGHRGMSSTLAAATIAVATGRGGRLRRRLGARRTQHRMVAVTTCETVPFPAIGARLLVDASDNGWWYALGDGARATIGYVTDADALANGADRLAATWRRAALGVEWMPAAARHIPLRARRCAVAVPDGEGSGSAVALGDAALAADPLSGHGLMLCLDGAAQAASDPAGYRQWLTERGTRYVEQEQALYRSSDRRRTGTFWRRRTGQ